MVSEKTLNMIASSTTPATRRWSRPPRITPAATAPSSTSSNRDTSGAKARAASVGVRGHQLLRELGHRERRALLRLARRVGRHSR